MRLISFAALLLAALSFATTPVRAQSVNVDQAWSRATAPHATTAAVYLTLTAGMTDHLIGGQTPVAKIVQVHETIMVSGIMRMAPVPGGLLLPEGRKVTLAPGGYHLMLIGMTEQLKPHDRFPLTLHFANEPPVTVVVQVGAAGATMPPDMMRMP